MIKVFIDGAHGTTGLRIHERLSKRSDIDIITIKEEHKKDEDYRLEAIDRADIAFLCLPDEAARKIVSRCDGIDTILIDTSTAHRTDDAWTYGFAEVADLRQQIADSKRIANPGCHASGFIALTAPLVEKGILSPDADLGCFSITGYSGGGKKMIADYDASLALGEKMAPGQYGLGQAHKHLPEMQKIAGLNKAPHFMPIVGPFYSGMQVTVPVFGKDISCGIDEIRRIYSHYYMGQVVQYRSECSSNGFLYADMLKGRDDMYVSVCGNEDRILLTAAYDNLGKGASGAAIQNMNIALGLEETIGLNLTRIM